MVKAEPRRNDCKPDMSRIERLVAQFNGQIKYVPMLMDHPDWTDDQCIEFAKKWDAVAVERYHAGGDLPWNDRIPYCRNIFKTDT